MAEKDPHHAEIKRGFNQGYRLAKEMPELKVKDVQKLPKMAQENPRLQGIVKGMEQYKKDQYIAKVKVKNPPQKNPNPSKGMDR